MTAPPVIAAGAAWMVILIFTTALSIYIRAAFYTCLYVWAITAEEVEEAMRHDVAPPAPFAAAFAANDSKPPKPPVAKPPSGLKV